MRRMVIVAFEGCQPLDVVGPYEVFAAAAALRAGRADRGYQVVLAAPGGGGRRPRPIVAESGLVLAPATSVGRLLGRGAAPLHTLVIAGGAGARRAARDRAVVADIRALAGRARRVASVCTGAFVLAAAGLLDGRRATTHWAHCAELAARHPAVRVEPDPIYVRDGRYWTSAGVTAGIDLALALVEEDLGRATATAVARELVVFVRRAGGQSQFSAQLAVQAAATPPIRELQSWIVEHPDAALDVPSLARRVALSVRHFGRLFRSQVGVGPATYVEQVRSETARRLLETTALSVEGVAEAAGFGTAAALRRTLGRRVGLSPREYRARFGPSAPASQPQSQPRKGTSS